MYKISFNTTKNWVYSGVRETPLEIPKIPQQVPLGYSAIFYSGGYEHHYCTVATNLQYRFTKTLLQVHTL